MSLIDSVYKSLNSKPFTKVYSFYKKLKITEALKANPSDFQKLSKGYGLGLDERIIEYPWLFSRLPSMAGRLLDAGSVLNFDYILSHPSLLKKKIFISTLAPEKKSFWRRSVSYIYEDMREICYKDDFFDWVVCLSVIEHIGLDNTKFYTENLSMNEEALEAYIGVIRELHRILKPGGTLYLSMPFGKHRNYGWLQTFNNRMVDAIVNVFSPTSFAEYYFRYDPDGWRASTRIGSAECEYFDFHNKGSKYRKDAPIAAGALVCMELIK